MSFKKIFQSHVPVILGGSENVDKKFPPGFCYRLGSIVYTVKEDVTKEISSPMREVILSDGATEIIPVESIERDIKEPGCQILEPDKRFSIKGAQKEVKKRASKKVKKVISKVKKKKVKKKKNG